MRMKRTGIFSMLKNNTKTSPYFFFMLLMLMGALVGIIICAIFSKRTLMLDNILYDSLLLSQEKQPFFDVLKIVFIKDFKLLFYIFILGMTPIGIIPLPLIITYKGFAVGFAGAFVFINYSFFGLMYDILIIFPAAVVSSIGMAYISVFAMKMSKFIYSSVSGGRFTNSNGGTIKDYTYKWLLSVIVILAATILETLCHSLFSGLIRIL